MRIKRQKTFALPALLSASGLLNTAMIGTSVVGIKQGMDAQKTSEEQMEQAEEHNRQQVKAMNKIAKAAEKNPQVAQQFLNTKQQTYSASAGTMKTAVGFAKDIGKFAWSRKKEIAGGLAVGGAIAGASAIADKVIQRDAKKNNIPIGIPEQRSYASVGSVMKKTGKFAKDVIKDNKKTMLFMGGAFGAAMPALGYMAEKKQYKDQIAQSETNSSPATQRSYAIPASVGSLFKNPGATFRGWGQSMKRGWKTFKSHPGESTIGGLGKWFGGGKEATGKMVTDLEKIGNKSGNAWTQKTANFLKNNKKTALAVGAGVGYATTFAPWEVGEKITKKGIKAVDKNAYAYQESKDKEVQ